MISIVYYQTGKPDLVKTKSVTISCALKTCTYSRHTAAIYLNHYLFLTHGGVWMAEVINCNPKNRTP